MKKIGTTLTALIISVSLTLPLGTYAMEFEDFVDDFDMEEEIFEEDFIDDTEDFEDDFVETDEDDLDVEIEMEETETEDLEFDDEELDIEFEVSDTFDATYSELNQLAVFLNQETNYTCTLCSATMMLRRAALLDGKDWRSITESAVRTVAWPGGLSWSFSYAGYSVYGGENFFGKSASQKWSRLKELLDAHPEGIVAYNGDDEHAVLLTDYTNGTWYCADPANAATRGRIPLKDAYKINGPSDITRVWYITSGAVTPPTIPDLPVIDPVTPEPDPEPELPEVDEAKCKAFVSRLYSDVLNRKPEASGLEYWVKKLTTRSKNGLQVADAFVNSAEFKKRNVSDSAYIDILYKAFMGRNADATGKAYWQDKLDIGMTRYYVFASFANSPEFGRICFSYGIEQGTAVATEARDQNAGVTGFVSRLYTKCLGRAYDIDGLNNWCKSILTAASRKEKALQVAYQFFSSKEFKSLEANMSDKDYITVLYRTFFNREPEASGMNYWLGKMDRGATRDFVLDYFMNSTEFAKIMNTYGIR